MTMALRTYLTCTHVEIKRAAWSSMAQAEIIDNDDAVATVFFDAPVVNVKPDGVDADGSYYLYDADGSYVGLSFRGDPSFSGNAYHMLEADDVEEEDDEAGEHPSVTVDHPASL